MKLLIDAVQSSKFLTEKKYGRTGLLTLVAAFFHSTAIIAIPLYGIYWLLRRVDGSQFVQNRLRISAPMMVVGLMGFLSVVALFCMPVIFKILSLVGLSKFNNYLEGNKLGIEFGQLVLRVPLFMILALNWRGLGRKTRIAPFYTAMLIFDTVSSQLVSIDVMAYRISNYFALYSALWLPQVCTSHRDRNIRVISVLLLLGYCVAYWYFTYVLQMRHETYPYVSIF